MSERGPKGREQQRISRQQKRRYRREAFHTTTAENKAFIPLTILLTPEQTRTLQRIAKAEGTTVGKHLLGVIAEDMRSPVMDLSPHSNMLLFPSDTSFEVLEQSHLSVVRDYPRDNVEDIPSGPSA